MDLTLRDVLLADARPHEAEELREAIDWCEKARDLVVTNRASMREIDLACPFNRGDGPWFFFVLLMNKKYKTLRGPYEPMMMQNMNAKDQAICDGLVCANCFAAGGPRMKTKLRRCAKCRLVAYCNRECQRKHVDQHRKYCSAEHDRVRRQRAAIPKFARFTLRTEDGVHLKLIARHLRDGYDTSSMLVLEDLDDGLTQEVRGFGHEIPYGVVTVPVRDSDVRHHLLDPHEAVFDTEHYQAEYEALVAARLIEPVPHKTYAHPSRPGNPVFPVARIYVDQISLGDL
ncbi:hypothetical protein CTAYLR_000352 [Chrysophaeum taylorii]|uniref:MYND-type domain-containing protein n=1 Tax=Chrysophaeum taylorii TaxID=2483200 RepID=A0AAD7UG16_9STRA|nr:hypothetical protein CTAYLR_000352 [Chrysophaeum taylorii]